MKQTRRSPAKKKSLHRVKHHARMAAVPHKKNGYRPHLIRWQGMTIMLAFALALQFAYNTWQTGSVLGQKADVTTTQLLELTNTARRDQGAAPLTTSPQLARAAHMKANDMFRQQYWAHVAPDGTTPWKWVKETGYSYTVAGENLAKNFVSSRGVVTAWLNSPEHRKNLLDTRYENVGFAVVPGQLNGESTMLVVALYGTPQTSGIAAGTTPEVLAARGSQGLADHMGVALQSLNPSVLATVALMVIITAVSLVAHSYRHHLPKEWRTSWKRHHGLYKAAGMTSLVVIVLALYGGGQI